MLDVHLLKQSFKGSILLNDLSKITGSAKKIIAVDLDDFFIKVVEVKKEGKKAVVSFTAQAERTGTGLTDDLASLFNGSNIKKGKCIIITEQVKFLASELNIKGAGRLSDEKLNAAAAWEMEPYLDFPPADGLFSCRVQAGKEDEENLPALISAIDSGVYNELSEQLKQFGLEITRAYAPEGALLSVSRLPEKGKNKAVINRRYGTVRGVMLDSGGPSGFREFPTDSVPAEAYEPVRDLIYDLTAATGGAEEVIITGSAVSEELVRKLKDEITNVRIWGREDFGGVDFEPGVDDLGPGYAVAIGAALQELGLDQAAPVGVTDRIPVFQNIITRFNEDKRLLPAVCISLFLILIAGHWGYVNTAITRYSSEIKRFKAVKQGLLRPLREKKRLSEKKAAIIRKCEYLREIIPRQNSALTTLLSALSEKIPVDVVINKLEQNQNGSFYLDGNAFTGRSIIAFNNSLSQLDRFQTTILETIKRDEDSSSARRKILPYNFSIRIQVKNR